MARFFNPEGKGGKADMRLHAPATARNHNSIYDALASHLPAPKLSASGLIFEVASGTGEHAARMAPKLANHCWQPTDIEDDHLTSIEAWRAHAGTANILPAKYFNVLKSTFDTSGTNQPLVAVLAINLIHISPWAVTEALIEKAATALQAETILYLYGPYKRDGAHTSESNAAFDTSLKSRDKEWGVRDMEAVIELAQNTNFAAPEIIPMPANNFSLIFKKLV